MISLITFFILAAPFCEGSVDVSLCSRFVANECVLEQIVNPGHDAEFYLEGAIEAAPTEWWPE
jgi:hypothetical protein